MLYTYIQTKEITKATPSGYTVKNLRNSTAAWNYYSTNIFTNREFVDFSITKNETELEYHNPHDAFIQVKSADVHNITVNDEETIDDKIDAAINIDSKWDNRFPESIRLKYPGILSSQNSSQRYKIDMENNYSFSIWSNRYTDEGLADSGIYTSATIPNINTKSYFYDLLSFIKLDGGSSYEDWLKRPSFSLRSLLTKSISVDDKLYQLYKVDDVNVQSLSTSFDEYVPWCFDQNGLKIDQYKIATITSFNKKEIYILLELRENDIGEKNSSVEIPTITNIVFWRSGDTSGDFKSSIRNKDQNLLVTNTHASNISEYFRESKILTDTLVDFQKDRLEDGETWLTKKDGSVDNKNNNYTLKSNIDSKFREVNAKTILRRFIFGKLTKNDNKTIINVNMSQLDNTEMNFTDHFKNKVHVFVNGKLLTTDKFYISNGKIQSSLKIDDGLEYSYVEIYINQYDAIEYSFIVEDNDINNISSDKRVKSLTQDDLSYILYESGFLWKTTQDKDYLLFDVDSNGLCKLVDLSNDSDKGSYVIIHGLFFSMINTNNVTPSSTAITIVNNTDNKRDAKDFNINYDPLAFNTLTIGTSGESNTDKDLWIFNNTQSLLKLSDAEPYLVNDGSKIKVLNVKDKNITILDPSESNNDIKKLKQSLVFDENNKSLENILSILIDESEKDYLVEHYEQMSIVNRNILNMFVSSRENNFIDADWTNLNANSKLLINKDYAIIRFKEAIAEENVAGNFPKLRIYKTYEHDGLNTFVDVKVKPVQVNGEWLYVLHRTDKEFGNLYSYSFDKPIKYIII